MKLPVDQKLVCQIPDSLVQNILNTISPEDWDFNNYRQTTGNMQHTKSIPIMHTAMCVTGENTMAAIDSIRPEPMYEKFIPVIQPVLDLLKEHYSFDKYAAFLAYLKPQSVIGMHPDVGYFLTKCHRIHVPLLTNPKVAYVIEDKEYYWERGNVYEFDNTRLHGVVNNSDSPRVHLVVNLYPEHIS